MVRLTRLENALVKSSRCLIQMVALIETYEQLPVSSTVSIAELALRTTLRDESKSPSEKDDLCLD
jgi:hypothetical protein